MDFSVKSSEKKTIIVGPFDKNKTPESMLSVLGIIDSNISSRKSNAEYDISKTYSDISGFDDQESNTCRLICSNYSTVTGNETTNYTEIDSEAGVITAKDNKTVCSSKARKERKNSVENSLEVDQSTEISSTTVVNSGTNDENSAKETEIIDKSRCDPLATCTKTTDDLITCNGKTGEPSNELPKELLPNNVIKSEEIVTNAERYKLLQQIYEIEKFFLAINSTNKDMEKKSGILLQKQNLVDEIFSYIHAVQSIIRLSTSRNLFTRILPNDSMTVYPYKPFYEAGEHILDELKLYRSELKADFKIWEMFRKVIVGISEQMPYDFELCEDEMSVKVLMHEISTKICEILRHMEMVTSKREDMNENCIDLMDSVDTYIRYSSAFIMSDRKLFLF